MKLYLNHFSINVLDLEKSLKFYEEAVGLKEVKRVEAADGRYIIVFLGEESTNFTMELTWLRDRTEKYDMGECEYHLAFRTYELEEARKKHKEMGVICYENIEMGLYFIMDPDGLWIEICPFRE